MHVDADVTLIRDERLTRVDADPHADRAAQRRLRLLRRRQRIRRPRERDEERIPLRIHLQTTVASKRLTQHPTVLRQRQDPTHKVRRPLPPGAGKTPTPIPSPALSSVTG